MFLRRQRIPDKKSTRSSWRKEGFDKSEDNAEAREDETPTPRRTRVTRSDTFELDTVFGNNTSQLPSDIRDTYKALKVLGDGEGVLPALIKVDKLTGKTWGYCSRLTEVRMK